MGTYYDYGCIFESEFDRLWVLMPAEMCNILMRHLFASADTELLEMSIGGIMAMGPAGLVAVEDWKVPITRALTPKLHTRWVVIAMTKWAEVYTAALLCYRVHELTPKEHRNKTRVRVLQLYALESAFGFYQQLKSDLIAGLMLMASIAHHEQQMGFRA
jgi:hypothetical protein